MEQPFVFKGALINAIKGTARKAKKRAGKA